MKGNKKLLAVLSIVCLLLVGVIVACIYFINAGYADSDTENNVNNTSVSGNDKVPIREDGKKYVPESYFEQFTDYEFELVYEEELDLVWKEKEVDFDVDLPIYQQTLVTEAEKLYETMEPVVEEFKKDQHLEKCDWFETSRASDASMAEIMYSVTTTTEQHFYECIACIEEDTPDGKCVVKIYKKVMTPQ